MHALSDLYGHSLALLTDLYQLTMSYGYWKSGAHRKDAVFHMIFRRHPFRGGFTVACGLHRVIEYLERFRFEPGDLQYLSTLTGNDDGPLFDRAFLDHLAELPFSCDIDAVPEGTIVFPQEPLVRVSGPIVQAQILETVLLNIVNFETLIATKSARVCLAARGEPVLEFGLRRAQGFDGGIAASRAAYVGGCSATSNVLAGRLFGIPVRGTHAHSWVMAFDDEPAAFEAYAQAMPNNCVFLVDTYDTVQGVRRAVEVGLRLRARGHEMIGVRLDSGDLAQLSIEARRILDESGFQHAVIYASNDLDEHIIESLRDQGARIGAWGVGTNLVTGYDQPALGGVYKLAAVREPGGDWEYRIKLSEQAVKVSNPGILDVRRYTDEQGGLLADMIYDVHQGAAPDAAMIDPLDVTRRRVTPRGAAAADVLVPIFRAGRRVYDVPTLDEVRAHTQRQLATLPAGLKRFVNPHIYPVGLEAGLFDLKTQLILQARGSVA
jgi:nicotinate phosphoribosyltransferase